LHRLSVERRLQVRRLAMPGGADFAGLMPSRVPLARVVDQDVPCRRPVSVIDWLETVRMTQDSREPPD
jgi:hypothetical protein